MSRHALHPTRLARFARLTGWLAMASLLIASLVPVPVTAGTPTIFRNVAIDDTNLLPNTSRQCGLDVYLRQFGSITFKVATRENGVTAVQEIAVHVAGTYFAPSTGRSVNVNVDDAGTNIETDYPDGSVKIMNAGSDGVITVPGYGHVYIGVGLVVVTVGSNGDALEVSVGARDPDHSGVCPLLR
jgi:hypothetical protein